MKSLDVTSYTPGKRIKVLWAYMSKQIPRAEFTALCSSFAASTSVFSSSSLGHSLFTCCTSTCSHYRTSNGYQTP